MRETIVEVQIPVPWSAEPVRLSIGGIGALIVICATGAAIFFIWRHAS